MTAKRYHPPEYISWMSMRARCNNPNRPGFNYYGGRGISICERWDSYPAFLADMGPRPVGCSLDRIDSNGNYEPSNCRWATVKEQRRNRRNNRLNLSMVADIRRRSGAGETVGGIARALRLGYSSVYVVVRGKQWV